MAIERPVHPNRLRLRALADKAIEELESQEVKELATIANQAAEIVYLRIGEYLSYEEIAAKLGIAVETVELRLVKARECGILSPQDEILGHMKNRLVPRALNVLGHHLAQNSEESAIATLKGAGVLVSHQRSQAVTESNTTLRLIVENRDGSPVRTLDPSTLTGQIVGVGNPDTEEASVIRKGI